MRCQLFFAPNGAFFQIPRFWARNRVEFRHQPVFFRHFRTAKSALRDVRPPSRLGLRRPRLDFREF